MPEELDDTASGETAARVRAVVNGYPIFDEEIQANAFSILQRVQLLPEPERSQKRREIYKEVLDQLIDRELLIQDARARLKKNADQVMGKLQESADKEFDRRWIANMKKSNGLKSDDDLKDMLRKQGLSLDMIRRQWTRQFLSTEYMRSRVLAVLDRISHEQMQEYYEQHPEEYKIDDAVEWMDLFVSVNNPRYKSSQDAQKAVQQIVAQLRKGEDFQKLYKEYHDGNVTPDAEGIGRKRGEIQPPECEEILFAMKPNDIDVVEIGSGFHIFRLVKREFAGKKPFDQEVQKEIRAKLRAAMFDREAKKLVADLKRKAVIDLSRSSR